jgi:hypothetical protein
LDYKAIEASMKIIQNGDREGHWRQRIAAFLYYKYSPKKRKHKKNVDIYIYEG